jgi:hypothetical protein
MLMLLMCALPLLVFFALALAGVRLNLLWAPLLMILCCLAMFFLTTGGCGHGRPGKRPEDGASPGKQIPSTASRPVRRTQ